MPEKLIPYRSQSHNLNDFYRRTAGEIKRLYDACNQLAEALELAESISRLQEEAVASRVRALQDALQAPRLGPEGIWEHRVGATSFAAAQNGAVLREFGLAGAATESAASCLLARAPDGTAVVPRSLRVEIEPPAGGGISDVTDPLCAVHGNRPWWRKASAGGAAQFPSTITVHLPLEILDRPEFGQLKIIPFPLYGTSVERIEYRYRTRWYELGNGALPADGPILLSFPPCRGDALRLHLVQKNPVRRDGREEFHLGLASLEVERVSVAKEPAVLVAAVNLAGQGPWQLLEARVDMAAPGRADVRLDAGGKVLSSHDLPAVVAAGGIRLTVTLEAEDGRCRPLFRGVTLLYRSTA